MVIVERFGRNNRIAQIADGFYLARVCTVSFRPYGLTAWMVCGRDTCLKGTAACGAGISFFPFFCTGSFFGNFIGIGMLMIVFGIRICICGGSGNWRCGCQHGDRFFFQRSAASSTGSLSQSCLRGCSCSYSYPITRSMVQCRDGIYIKITTIACISDFSRLCTCGGF